MGNVAEACIVLLVRCDDDLQFQTADAGVDTDVRTDI